MKYAKPFTLLLIFIIVFISGCSNTTQTTKSEPEQPKQIQQVEESKPQEIKPSFPTKKYDTPFIEFEYPASWDDSDKAQSLGDKDSIKVIVGDTKNATCITVKQKFNQNINSAEQARTEFINICDSMQSIKYLDKISIIKGNIAVLEGIVYGKFEIRAREYFWNDGKGKTYQIEISSDNKNWDNLKEVTQVLEQSLKFK